MNDSASEPIDNLLNPIDDPNDDVIVDVKNEQVPCSPIVSNNIIIEDDYGFIKVN